jgi:hypothetical protein
MIRAAAAAISITSLIAVSALAEPAVKGACPAPGTELQTSKGSTLTVIAANGLICQLRSSITGDFALVGLLLRLDTQRQPSKEGVAAIASLWPLAAGKSAQYTLTDANGAWIETYKVGAREKVTTQAGAFDAFPIEQTETPANGGADAITVTSLVAPALGYIVRFKVTIPGGAVDRPGSNDWELVSVKKP